MTQAVPSLMQPNRLFNVSLKPIGAADLHDGITNVEVHNFQEISYNHRLGHAFYAIDATVHYKFNKIFTIKNDPILKQYPNYKAGQQVRGVLSGYTDVKFIVVVMTGAIRDYVQGEQLEFMPIFVDMKASSSDWPQFIDESGFECGQFDMVSLFKEYRTMNDGSGEPFEGRSETNFFDATILAEFVGYVQ